jgi:hypothetical protein
MDVLYVSIDGGDIIYIHAIDELKCWAHSMLTCEILSGSRLFNTCNGYLVYAALMKVPSIETIEKVGYNPLNLYN